MQKIFFLKKTKSKCGSKIVKDMIAGEYILVLSFWVP